MNRREFIKTFAAGGATIVVGGQVTGCKTLPTTEQMFVTAELIGRSTGKVIILTNITDDERDILITVFNKIGLVVPGVDEKFEDVWVKAAEDYLATVELDAAVKALIVAAVKVAGKGIDYIFEKRYPDAKQYRDLVEAAIHGFIDGITTVLVPPNNLSASYNNTYDAAAYEYLKQFQIKK